MMSFTTIKKSALVLLLFFVFSSANAQYVRSSHVSFSPQELIEDVLFSSNCVEDIQIVEEVSGSFNDGMLSYGFFESVNSSFPFESGLVLSTGRLNNVDGPNNRLSDDDAPGWVGDDDLEEVLGISNTINATVLRFTFTPNAQNISFRYIFASEEYRANNRTTCDFSDAFAFLIRPLGSANYQNIAVVPGTETPVAVTTVRPQIAQFCDAINEDFFGQFNAVESPINFNGQTDILTAEANVIPNQTYEVKLVIADEGNARFDSAVFLEANSFNVGFNLGRDRTGLNSLCESDELLLEIPQNLQSNPITWLFNGNPILNENGLSYLVSEANLGAGLYAAEVDLGNGCLATDTIEVNFEAPTSVDDLVLSQCTSNEQDVRFNLNGIVRQLTAQNLNLVPVDYFENLADATNSINPISSPENYEYTAGQNVFVSLSNSFGCISIAEIELKLETALFPELSFATCVSSADNSIGFDVFATLNRIVAESNLEQDQTISLFRNQIDAANAVNSISGTTLNFEIEELPLTYFARVNGFTGCSGLIPVRFEVSNQVEVEESEVNLLFCREDETLRLDSGFDAIQYELTWSTGENTSSIDVSEPGRYEVIIDLLDAPSPNCSTTKIFNVEVSSTPTLDYILRGVPGNYTVEIFASGEGIYEFSLNGGPFQQANVFSNLDSFNTIRVRDQLGCGENQISFSTLIFPEFFTPNGDGIHDTWFPQGLDGSGFQLLNIQIFDRYGKIISILTSSSRGWDGTYKGKLMPQDDYWYKANFEDQPSLKGNFSLIR